MQEQPKLSGNHIKELIIQMEDLANKQEYEKAQQTMLNIKDEITKPEEKKGVSFEQFEKLLKGEREPISIKETYNIILSHPIRLNPEQYPFSKMLKLTIDANRRLVNIKNPYLASNIDKVRRIVAEEMVCNQMTVQPTYRGIKPNRAFLDIALKINPSICKGELERRARVNYPRPLSASVASRTAEAGLPALKAGACGSEHNVRVN